MAAAVPILTLRDFETIIAWNAGARCDRGGDVQRVSGNMELAVRVRIAIISEIPPPTSKEVL